MTAKAGAADNLQKFVEMFERRAAKGQCINQPYLGCREFACDFRLVDPQSEPAAIPEELQGSRPLGWMLYDMDFTDPATPNPRFFQAAMQDGLLAIPAWNSKEVRG